MNLTREDALELDKERTPGPVVDTSFARAVELSARSMLNEDLSISEWLASGAVRDRDAKIKAEIKELSKTDPTIIRRVQEANLKSVKSGYGFDPDSAANFLNEYHGEERYQSREVILAPTLARFAEERKEYEDLQNTGNWATTGGTLVGAVTTGFADPANIALTVATAGLGTAYSVGSGGLRAAAPLAGLVSTAQKYKTLGKMTGSLRTGGFAALEGAVSEAAIMTHNDSWRNELGNPITAEEVLLTLGISGTLGFGMGVGGHYLNARGVIKKVDDLIAEAPDNLEYILAVMDGTIDANGRRTKPDVAPEPPGVNTSVGATGWADGGWPKASWTTEEGPVGVIYAKQEAIGFPIAAQFTVEGQLVPGAPVVKRTNFSEVSPYLKARGKVDAPLNDITPVAYKSITGAEMRGLLDGSYDPTVTGTEPIEFFTTTTRAADQGAGEVQVSYNTSKLVGRVKYHPTQMKNRWEKGDIVLRVAPESRKTKGKKGQSSVMFDAVDEIRMKASDVQDQKLHSRMRKEGFKRTREGDEIVFKRKRADTSPVDPLGLKVAADDMVLATDNLVRARNSMAQLASAPMDELPFDMFVKLYNETEALLNNTTKPVRGSGVAQFETTIGRPIQAQGTPAGRMPTERMPKAVARELDAEVEAHNRWVNDNPDEEMLVLDESAEVSDVVSRKGNAKQMTQEINESIATTEKMIACALGVTGGK